MASPDDRPSFLHPASGILILALDWVLFSGSVITLGLSTPALAITGFALAAIGTGIVQRTLHRDGAGMIVVKSLLAGITVGIPLPVAGTAVGGGVLALSGLNRIWERATSGEKPPPLSSPRDEANSD